MSKERLYESFGELVYVLAMADGRIDPSETKALDQILEKHAWAKDIRWSFDYEAKRSGDLEGIYEKALYHCQQLGPNPEYAFMIEVMEAVADASNGIDADEQAVIDGFQNDLIARFKSDLEKGRLL